MNEEITLERAAIYSVLQAGIPAFFAARDLGVRSDHFEDEEKAVWSFIESFVMKDRLPSITEINIATGVALSDPNTVEPFDVETVSRAMVKRALGSALADGLGGIARLKNSDPHEARRRLIQLVHDTSWSIGRLTSYTDPNVAQSVLDRYQRVRDNPGMLLGLSSPWPTVDKYSLGLQPGEVTVLLGKRKVLKTFILFKWMLHCLRNDLGPGDCMLVVSTEMLDTQIYRRCAAIDLRLCYQAFREGTLTTEEEQRLEDWVAHVRSAPADEPTFHAAGTDVLTNVTDVVAKTAELKPKAVWIDSFYGLDAPGKGMWEKTLYNIKHIKIDVAAGCKVPVVVTSQLKGEKDKNSLSASADDAAYAKALGDWADAIRYILMDDEYDRMNRRLFTAGESREFRGRDIVIQCCLNTMNFDELRTVNEDTDEHDGDEFDGDGPPTPPAPPPPPPPPDAPEPLDF